MDPQPRSSLEYGTKLARPPRAYWYFTLYPEAAEGGGAFQTLGRPKLARRARVEVDGEPGPEAARRARSKVRRYCAANRLNRLGTLTYAGAGNHDPVALRSDLAEFFRRLRGSVGAPFPYLWVPEWHPKGHGLHAHFAVGRWVARGAIERAWGRGYVHIKLLGDLPVGSGTLGEARLAARYLAKYVGKDLASGGQPCGLHRYEVAQGFQPTGVRIADVSASQVVSWAETYMGRKAEKVWRSTEDLTWAGPPAVWASWA